MDAINRLLQQAVENKVVFDDTVAEMLEIVNS